MKTITLADIREPGERKKAAFSWIDDKASTVALRNSSEARTEAKRKMRMRVQEREKASHRKP